MSEQRGVFIGQCGHLMPLREPHRELSPAGVPGRARCRRRGDRSAEQIVALADDAPALVDEQLWDRLIVLADNARDLVVSSSTFTDPRPAAG